MGRGRARRWLAVVLVAAFALGIALPLGRAWTAGEDATAPPGAAGLADVVKDQLWRGLHTGLAPVRTVIRGYEQVGKQSFLVHVTMFDLLWGPFERSAYAVAPCWAPGNDISGSWDTLETVAELRSELTGGARACEDAS